MLKYIFEDMIAVFRYLPYGIVAGIIVAIILSAINGFRRKHNKSIITTPAVTCYAMYLVILLIITFFSRESGSRSAEMDFEWFSTWGINARNNAYVIENVLLFIPYGFVCGWALKSARTLISCTVYGFATSVFIETIQLVTKRGYFQVDDILTNVIGTVLGYIFFRCVFCENNKSGKRIKLMYCISAVIIIMTVIARIPELAGDNLEIELMLGNNPTLATMILFTEYAAIAIMFGFSYELLKTKRSKIVNYFYAVITCGIIAGINEIIQYYVFHEVHNKFHIVFGVIGGGIGGIIYLIFSKLLLWLREE